MTSRQLVSLRARIAVAGTMHGAAPLALVSLRWFVKWLRLDRETASVFGRGMCCSLIRVACSQPGRRAVVARFWHRTLARSGPAFQFNRERAPATFVCASHDADLPVYLPPRARKIGLRPRWVRCNRRLRGALAVVSISQKDRQRPGAMAARRFFANTMSMLLFVFSALNLACGIGLVVFGLLLENPPKNGVAL